MFIQNETILGDLCSPGLVHHAGMIDKSHRQPP